MEIWLLVLALTGCVFWFVRASFAVVTVEHFSMAPTFQDGDRVLVCRCWLGAWLRRGRIVVLQASDLPGAAERAALARELPGFQLFPAMDIVNPEGELYIKRVVALAGETFQAEVEGPEQPAERRSTLRAWRIPPGHLFVCGDNSAASRDSRQWGPVPRRAVWGIVLMRLRSRGHSRIDEAIRAAALSGPAVGRTAPEFQAETLQGERVTPATYAGRRHALVFINPESAACRELLAVYNHERARLAGAGVQLVVVSSGSGPATHALAEALALELPLLLAPPEDNPMLQDYRVPGVPYFCAMNAQGHVRAHGYATADYRPLLMA
jgi:signal peptidase I